MTDRRKIWADPVWSKIISAVIIFIGTSIYLVVSSWLWTKSFWTTLAEFWTLQIDIWVLLLVSAIIIIAFTFGHHIKLTKTKPSPTGPFKKYIGIYEVYHFAPHTTGTPKLTKSFLQIDPDKTQYVHPLFDCEDGEIERIDGHIFLNLKNKEQKNAPSYFVLKSINDADIGYLGGVCLGIGQNQNCHPIAVKVALVRRNDITDFSIDKYKPFCSIEEFPKEKLQVEFYRKLVFEFLWNKCGDKDILF